jgi:plastocyanin
MHRLVFAVALTAPLLGIYGCGGYGGGSPTTPAGLPSATPDAIVIDIVGENGARSFNPNPATIPAGRVVVWHNVDNQTHRVVLNDGRSDTGDIGPGRFSGPMTIPPPAPYHCSIHPSMIGTLAAAQ